jgi:hypothetical protein
MTVSEREVHFVRTPHAPATTRRNNLDRLHVAEVGGDLPAGGAFRVAPAHQLGGEVMADLAALEE